MTNIPRYARTGTDNGRNKTASLWQGSLDNYVPGNPNYGLLIDDDFKTPRVNTSDASHELGWFIQDAAAGGTSESFITTNHPDGEANLSAATGTDHFGIEAHYGASATTQGVVSLPTATSNSRGRVVYETRINIKNMDNFFIGLTEPIVEFLSATGTLPTNSDYIGFYRADGGALVFSVANDNSGGTAVTDTFTVQTQAQMVALEDASSNYVKLGFAVNPDNSVEVVFNGTYYSHNTVDISSTALPIEALTAKYAVTRGATDDLTAVSFVIDWISVFGASLTGSGTRAN